MEENIAFYYEEKGAYAPREGFPFVRRNNIAAIIKYKTQFLFLSWNEVDYDGSLVTGGIDEGEDKIEAVKREVKEETGYYDILDINPVDAINISKFFVEHKGQNREAVYFPYLVELASLNQSGIEENEKKEHSWIWVKKSKLNDVNLFENHRMMLNAAIKVINLKNKNSKVNKISSKKEKL